MRKFLQKTAIALVLLYLGALVMDVIISKGLLKMEDYRFQDYAAMLDGGMGHEILIMGNSRGKSHFDPYIIDSLLNVSSFCIGVGGYPINVQRLKYDLYCEHNSKPSVILQNIDPMSMNQIHDVRHQHQSEQFFPLVYDRLMRKELRDVGYTWKELYVPMLRYYGYQMVIKNGLLEALTPKHYVSNPAYKGHRAERGAWDGTELAKIKEQEIPLDEYAKKQFEEYLSECRKDSIKVILVFSPLYIEALNTITNLDDAKAYFKETAERFDFPYLDYTEDPISQDTTNFCVSVHLNPTATQAFTRQLCRDLDSLKIFHP